MSEIDEGVNSLANAYALVVKENTELRQQNDILDNQVEKLIKRNSNRVTKIDELAKERAELRQQITELTTRAENAERLNNVNAGLVDQYQRELIPGFRQRAEDAEVERDKLKNCQNCGNYGADTKICFGCENLHLWCGKKGKFQ